MSGGEVRAAIFIVNPKKYAQKLRRIILLHFRLVTFRFNFGKTRKVIILMIFGLFGVSTPPKTNYVLSLESQNYSNNSRTNPEPFLNNRIFLEISKSWKSKMSILGERQGPGNLEDPFNMFWKILNMASIAAKTAKTWNGHFVILWTWLRSPRTHQLEDLQYSIEGT